MIDDGGWLTPEVADAQLALVKKQLQEPDKVEPFAAFKWAMEQVKPMPAMILDVGCGVGHYGALCCRLYPDLRYYGTDYSLEMIARARRLVHGGNFRVSPFEANYFGVFPLVLVSQVMEYRPDPWVALDLVLERFELSPLSQWLILHRIRYTDKDSRRITEPTYCGHSGNNYLWNRSQFRKWVSRKGEIVGEREWAGNITMVVRK